MISSVFVQPGDDGDADRFGVGGPDECFGRFVDEVARFAGVGIDFDQAETLMAAVDFLVA